MKFFPLLLMLLFAVLPGDATAAGLIPCDGPDCSLCDFAELGNGLLKWLIGILMVVFAMIVVSAGFGLVTSGGNTEAKSSAKKKIVNAIIGLVIVLAAWLLIDTVMRMTLAGESGDIGSFGNWSTIKCGKQISKESALDFPDAVVKVGGFADVPQGDPSVAGPGVTHAAAVAQLTAAGVKIKTEDGNAELGGIKQHVLTEVIKLSNDLKANCPTCNDITVTEGTGGKHAAGTYSHANGFKLDLRTRDNAGFVDYIKNNPDKFKPAGAWSNGTPLYYDSSSCGVYAIEGDHVDVSYKSGCPNPPG
jgi:hypothetical protein